MYKALTLVFASFVASFALAGDMALPPLKTQTNAQMVFEEHVDALNNCDWNRLMAQYPPEVEIHLPDGVIVKGRDKVGELFAGFCKDRKDGGLKGLKFTAEHSFAVDGTLNVQWRAEADFLKEPYKGSDAYVTKDGLMYAQVTTFNGADLKFK
jgi:SnoaL-like domain